MSNAYRGSNEDAAVYLQPEKQESFDSDEHRNADGQQPMMEKSLTDFARTSAGASDGRNGQQPSLAQSLRQRREFKEHMDNERAIYGKVHASMSYKISRKVPS